MSDKPMWMVRAEVGGRLFDEFESRSIVAIGWVEMEDMGSLSTREEFAKVVARKYPDNKKAQTVVSAGQSFRFATGAAGEVE